MKELLRNIRRRRENPLYRQWTRPRLMLLSWRGTGWLAMNATTAWMIAYWSRHIPMAYIPFILLFPLTLLIFLPLCFAWFMPPLGQEELEELSLTRLTEEEIGWGMLLPPLRMALFPFLLLILGIACYLAISPPWMSGSPWHGEDAAFLFFTVAGLSIYAITLCACVRQFAGRGSEPVKNVLFSMVRLMVVLAGFVSIMATILIGHFTRNETYLFLTLICLALLVLGSTVRYTLRHLASRTVALLHGDVVRRVVWSHNERVSESERKKRKEAGWRLLRTAVLGGPAVMTFSCMLLVLAASILLLSLAVREPEFVWSLERQARGVFTFPMSVSVALLAAVIHGLALRRKLGSPLPVIAGGLIRTTLTYSAVPIAIGWGYLLMGAALQWLLRVPMKSEEVVLYLMTYPVLAGLLIAATLSMVPRR